MLEKPSKIKQALKITKTLTSLKTVSCTTVPSLSLNKSFGSLPTTKHSYSRSTGRTPTANRSFTYKKEAKPLPKYKIHSQNTLSSFELEEIAELEEVFYLGNGREFNPNTLDDKYGNYKIFPSDQLGYRFEIIEQVGSGTFGAVVKCLDHKKGDLVAVKIIKKDEILLEAGKNEIEILDILQKTKVDETHIVRKLENFWFRGHICIVFELLAVDLYEFIKRSQFQGLHINFAKRIIVQTLIALKHSHKQKIVHCDLKPENILLKQENKSSIKLIDFGSAYKPGGPKYDYVQTRFYRAPEVILESAWNEKIDIWSIGCLSVELITGWPLFTGNSELEVFFHMVNTLGKPPRRFFNKGKKSEIFGFDEIETAMANFKFKDSGIDCVLEGQDKNLVDFVKKCLRWDPCQRMSAEEALGHPWFKCRTL